MIFKSTLIFEWNSSSKSIRSYALYLDVNPEVRYDADRA